MFTYIPYAIAATTLYTAVMAATCSNFTVVTNNPAGVYTTTMNTARVSAIVNCTGSHLGSQLPSGFVGTHCNSTQCALWVPSDYAVELHAYLNLTSASNDTIDNILQLAYDATYGSPDHNPNTWSDFNRTAVHTFGGSSICLNENAQAFWGFTPTYECVEGILSGCSGDGAPSDNTPITACGIQLLDSGRIFAGAIHTVQIVTGNDDSKPAPPNATAISTDTNGGQTATPTNTNGGQALTGTQGARMLFWNVAPVLAILGLQML